MKLAELLGLLGLLSIVILILIYIIKPNFQQKYISTTFVWKLSLKYRKKRIPVSKLRNILLVICQVLILTSCALILARPVVEAEKPDEYIDKIIVIDSSANMRAKVDDVTRFQRAIEEVADDVEEVLEQENGRVSIILAGSQAKFLTYAGNEVKGEIRLAGYDMVDYVLDTLNAIIDDIYTDPEYLSDYCSYTSADLEGAIKLSEEIFDEDSVSPDSEVILYSGIKYQNEFSENGRIRLVDMSLPEERNAAILGATAYLNEHSAYTFSADVAVYGQAVGLEVEFTIHAPNATDDVPDGMDNISWKSEVINLDDASLSGSEGNVVTVMFDTWAEYNESEEDTEDPRTVHNYQYVEVKLNVIDNTQFSDAFSYDDEYYIYGGRKPKINVLYVSPDKHPYYLGVLNALKASFADSYDISFEQGTDFNVTEGYDLYLYEYQTPNVMPEDGAVIFLFPQQRMPKNSGLIFNRVSGSIDPEQADWNMAMPFEVYEPNKDHPLLKYIDSSSTIYSTAYSMLNTETQNEYEVLMTCQDDPVLLVKNTSVSKVMAYCGDFHFSNASDIPGFGLMLYSAFNYFFPNIVTGNSYEIGDTITINTITDKVSYINSKSSNGELTVITDFPCEFTLDVLGTYTFIQDRLSKDRDAIEIQIYVNIPAKESNIFYHDDVLLSYPVVEIIDETIDQDLLLWFAAALVALLFAEWCLQLREQF